MTLPKFTFSAGCARPGIAVNFLVKVGSTKLGFDINASDPWGCSGLWRGCEAGYVSIVESILEPAEKLLYY